MTFGYGGLAEMDVPAAPWWGKGFELKVAFRPQYVHGYAGPLVSGAGFTLGLGDERYDPPGPKLRLAVAGQELQASAPLMVGRWHEAGLRVHGGRLELLLDAKVLARGVPPASASEKLLQLGSQGNPLEQFFGQIGPVEWRTGTTWSSAAVRLRGGCRRQAEFAEPQEEFSLPFPDNAPWRVVQGFDQPGGSHTSYAAFCLDLVRADQPELTRHSPFVAVASGQMVAVEDSYSGPARATRLGQVVASGHVLDYLHLVTGSATVKVGQRVHPGQRLGLVGDVGVAPGGYHLHLALLSREQRPFVTVPFALHHYQVSDDQGRTWRLVDRGVPRTGQWIRKG